MKLVTTLPKSFGCIIEVTVASISKCCGYGLRKIYSLKAAVDLILAVGLDKGVEKSQECYNNSMNWGPSIVPNKPSSEAIWVSLGLAMGDHHNQVNLCWSTYVVDVVTWLHAILHYTGGCIYNAGYAHSLIENDLTVLIELITFWQQKSHAQLSTRVRQRRSTRS